MRDFVVTVLIGGFFFIGKMIVSDLVSDVVKRIIRRTLHKNRRAHAFFTHGRRHVLKTPDHKARSPLQCSDGDCAKVRIV